MCINKMFIVPSTRFQRERGARHARGFSLVEAIVFIVIVSVALAGVLSVMNLTAKHSADPLIRKQAIAVAESLLEEIELQNFAVTSAPVAPTQPNRPLFDDIGDYNGFAPGGVFPIDSATQISGLTGYSVSVTVANADLGPAASLITAASGKAKLITVTVTGPDNTTIVLSGYRSAYGS